MTDRLTVRQLQAEIKKFRAALLLIELLSAGSICNRGRPDINHVARKALGDRT